VPRQSALLAQLRVVRMGPIRSCWTKKKSLRNASNAAPQTQRRLVIGLEAALSPEGGPGAATAWAVHVAGGRAKGRVHFVSRITCRFSKRSLRLEAVLSSTPRAKARAKRTTKEEAEWRSEW
jgi:hypothetical protein